MDTESKLTRSISVDRVTHNPIGVQEGTYIDPETGLIYFSNTQNVDWILDDNAELRNHGTLNKKDEYWPVAKLPVVVVEHLQREGIWDDDEALAKWLDDPANANFRTTGFCL